MREVRYHHVDGPQISPASSQFWRSDDCVHGLVWELESAQSQRLLEDIVDVAKKTCPCPQSSLPIIPGFRRSQAENSTRATRATCGARVPREPSRTHHFFLKRALHWGKKHRLSLFLSHTLCCIRFLFMFCYLFGSSPIIATSQPEVVITPPLHTP